MGYFESGDVVRYRGRLFTVARGVVAARPNHVIIEDDEGNMAMVPESEVSEA